MRPARPRSRTTCLVQSGTFFFFRSCLLAQPLKEACSSCHEYMYSRVSLNIPYRMNTQVLQMTIIVYKVYCVHMPNISWVITSNFSLNKRICNHSPKTLNFGEAILPTSSRCTSVCFLMNSKILSPPPHSTLLCTLHSRLYVTFTLSNQ